MEFLIAKGTKQHMYISDTTLRRMHSENIYGVCGLLYFCLGSLHSEQGIDEMISKQTEKREYSLNFNLGPIKEYRVLK